MPDIVSSPANVTDSGAWYHRRRSGGRSGVAPVTEGGVASTLTVNASVLVPPALEARHSSVVPDVSSVTSRASHPDVVHGDSGSDTVQRTFTGPRNHPSSPSGPVTSRVMTGAVLSVGAAPADATPSTLSPATTVASAARSLARVIRSSDHNPAIQGDATAASRTEAPGLSDRRPPGTASAGLTTTRWYPSRPAALIQSSRVSNWTRYEPAGTGRNGNSRIVRVRSPHGPPSRPSATVCTRRPRRT